MYSLFSTPPRAWGGQISLSRFKNARDRISEDMQKVIDYYRQGTSFCKTDHLLVKLITSMNVPLSYELDRYYEVASARTLSMATILRMTTSIGPGKWHEGVFYYGCKEIILGYMGADSPIELAKDWKNLKPVKVLECPVSNLWYMLPDGNKHNIEEGIATIAIDIPALMVMYRGFVLEQRRKWEEGGEQNIGIRDFVGKYVIPNMLYSQTDLAICNRLFNLQTGAPMGDSTKRHPFRVSDYTSLLDGGLQEVLRKFQTVKMPYGDMLHQFPTISSDYPLAMPDVSETRQVWWALFMTRLKAISFLFQVAGEKGRHYNSQLINQLRIDLRAFKSENIFKSVLPEDILLDANYEMKQMLDLL